MIKTTVLRYASIGLASISMAGFAAASTVSFDTTGADSTQMVKLHNDHSVQTTNKNNVGVANVNLQKAESGDVSVVKNTSIGGNVGSGSASNENETSTSVTISNDGACGCVGAGAWTAPDDDVTISTTGADSVNKVQIDNSTSVKTTNTNNVEVLNMNLQSAESGKVTATKNTTIGGDVMSGDASNWNSTTTSVSISN